MGESSTTASFLLLLVLRFLRVLILFFQNERSFRFCPVFVVGSPGALVEQGGFISLLVVLLSGRCLILTSKDGRSFEVTISTGGNEEIDDSEVFGLGVDTGGSFPLEHVSPMCVCN